MHVWCTHYMWVYTHLCLCTVTRAIEHLCLLSALFPELQSPTLPGDDSFLELVVANNPQQSFCFHQLPALGSHARNLQSHLTFTVVAKIWIQFLTLCSRLPTKSSPQLNIQHPLLKNLLIRILWGYALCTPIQWVKILNFKGCLTATRKFQYS